MLGFGYRKDSLHRFYLLFYAWELPHLRVYIIYLLNLWKLKIQSQVVLIATFVVFFSSGLVNNICIDVSDMRVDDYNCVF